MSLFTIFSKPGKLVMLAAMLLSLTALQAQTYQYNDSWGNPGISLQSQSVAGVKLNYSIEQFDIVENNIDGVVMKNIQLPGVFLPNDAGFPDLPGLSRFIAIPQGSKAVLNVRSYRTETVSDINVAPAFEIPLDTDKGPLKYPKNQKIYTTNALYPEQPFKLSEITSIRGVDVVMVGITPFQYNPVTKQLIVYRDVEIEVTFEGGNGHFGEDRLRNRWFDPIVMDAVLNYESLPAIDYNSRYANAAGKDLTGYEYLIVVPNSSVWTPYAEQIKAFRNKQGIYSGIVTLAEIGGNTPTILENYFNNAFNTWDIPPVAVLLMADYGTDANTTITSPIYNSYCVSDNIFADVTGNSMPDIIFARMTAQNATHLQTMVSKAINYETSPPTNPSFYQKPITALGWQTERWFQICSEAVGGFWRKQGKEPVRINAVYSGTPGTVWSTATNTNTVVSYFGPSGRAYIPQTPNELGGWTGGTPAQVNAALNAGAFMLQHRDHGFENGWGEPAYETSHISGLTNTDLCFVFSINCLTGKYNYSSEVFAEKFHRYTYNGQNSGALGLIAASEVSYSFVNDAFVWGMFDNMYPEYLPDYGMPVQTRGLLPAFGNASGKYFLQQSSWPYNTGDKAVTYNLFHHHGDAFTQVYSEVPQNMAITHNPILYSGESTFTVVADAGAFIALTVNGQIIGTAMSNGGATSVIIQPQLPPSQVLVTVTKQNYYRYEGTVDVIPPSGPYVVGTDYTINDASGNNNGLADYGENISLNVTMKNVGVVVANNVNVTISTTDQYVTITDNFHNFGTIQPNATVTINNAFALTVAQNIPDNHVVSIQLSSTNGTETWVSYLSITGHAPALAYLQYTMSDPTGNNNGFLDPGETATMTLSVKNNGTSSAYAVMGQLTTSDQYVTVTTTTPQAFGNLAPGATGTANYIVSAAANTPPGHVSQLTINLTANMGISQQAVMTISFADYCDASTSTQDEYISKVVIGTISNSSGWQGGVANYTNITTILEPGVAKPITITNGTPWASDMVTVWVDWNLDKEFSGAGETYTLTNVGGTGASFTGNVTPPANQQGGSYRMRIRMTYSTAPTPCGSATYGEIEDYVVIIQGGTTLNPPQNLAASVSNNDVTLTWTAPATDALLGYNVYRGGAMIAQQITALTYVDMDLPAGTYSYQVCAVYTEGTSAMAGPVQAVITGGTTSNAWETFEDYTAGQKLATQANAMGRTYWTTWSNTPGSAEDPAVSNAVAHDGNNSVIIQGTNDCVLLLGNKTSGKYSLNFYVNIPTGFYGYFNVLQNFAGANSVWGTQAYFDANGVGSVDAGGEGAGSFTYTYNTWIFVEVVVDLDADWAEFYVNGADVVQWQWSLGTFGTPGPVQLSAANFYAWAENGTPKAYFDDIDFKPVTSSLIFEPFEDYTAGQKLVQQAVAQGKDYWTTWSNTPGSAEDPIVSTEHAFAGSNSVLCQGTNDFVMLFGDKTSGKYSVNFYIYIPTGKVGYYNILQKFAGASSIWGSEVYYNPNGTAKITANGTAAIASFTYGYDQWIYMENIIDLNSDHASIKVNGTEVYAWQWSVGASGGGINQLGGMDIYAATTNGSPYFFVDDIEYKEFLSLAAPTNLVASVNDNDITLTWNAPPSDGFLGYNVYRGTQTIATLISALTFTDYDLLPGTYAYDVKAVYDEGYSPGAGPVNATVAGGTAREMVILEIGTGTWCQYCPGAAMGADQLTENGKDVAIIEYHSGDTYETTESGYRVNTYYGITGFPTAYFDGVISVVGGSQTQSMYAAYLPHYETRSAKVSLFELSIEPVYLGGTNFNLTVNANNIYPYPGNNLVLHVVCTESHIPVNWYGQTEVNFVCRKMMPDQMGTAINFGGQPNHTITLPLNYGTWNIENCQAIAFIQDNTTKEILQATRVDLGLYVGIQNPEVAANLSVYPNPATNQVNIATSGTLTQVKIMNNTGQLIFNQITDGQLLQINTSSFNTGVYFIEIHTTQGMTTQKLVIR